MPKILNVYKPKGLTPFQTIQLVREKLPKYKDETIGFAGRLDPLAHGVLLLMIGEETTKEKDKYLNLPKIYEFEAVFGVTTDTYDALGMIMSSRATERSRGISYHETTLLKRSFDFVNAPLRMTKIINKFIQSKLGKQNQQYPPYSSKTVKGKPLYLWARENKLSEIEIPKREIEIYDFKLLSTNTIAAHKLRKEIRKQIDSVTGDFRQEQIVERWNDFFRICHFEEAKRREISFGISQPLQGFEMTTFQTARFTISCSSGTYVRSLVNELGEKLGTGAITLEILRTKAGAYSLNNAIKLI